jgi:serine/threonine protein kinase
MNPIICRYGADLARGVLDLHSRGIFVLNLKPCNFLLDEHDHAVLGDFGIPSLLFGLSLPNADLIQRLGTPNYMAPEQWQPNIRGPISYETDSWGFACSILEMFSGVQPWRGKSPDEIYQLVVLKKEKPIFPYNMPPEIENVLSGCFEYDFRDRPMMTDILHAFER